MKIDQFAGMTTEQVQMNLDSRRASILSIENIKDEINQAILLDEAELVRRQTRVADAHYIKEIGAMACWGRGNPGDMWMFPQMYVSLPAIQIDSVIRYPLNSAESFMKICLPLDVPNDSTWVAIGFIQ